MERDEHRLVIESLTKLESERKAFRLIGGVLVEKTVGEVLPAVSQNFEGVRSKLFLQNSTFIIHTPFRILTLRNYITLLS